jgi:hypothetical protein
MDLGAIFETELAEFAHGWDGRSESELFSLWLKQLVNGGHLLRWGRRRH